MGSMTAAAIDVPATNWPDAACLGDDPSDWFPDTAAPEAIDPLRAVCWTCPVRDDCLAHAIEHREEYGVWGGMNYSQRHRIRKRTTTAAREWSQFHARKADEAKQAAKRARHRDDQPEPEPVVLDTDTAADILAATAASYGLTPSDLTGRSLAKDAVAARHTAMRRIRHELAMPYTAIGQMFNRDHTTVIYAIQGRADR